MTAPQAPCAAPATVLPGRAGVIEVSDTPHELPGSPDPSASFDDSEGSGTGALRPAHCRAASPAIEGLRARLEATSGAAQRERVLDEFWHAHPASPLIELAPTPGERIFTFVWRDAPGDTAAEVRVFIASITDDPGAASGVMRRLDGTDLWHLSVQMRSDWRASYGFAPSAPGETPIWAGWDPVSAPDGPAECLTDPANPLTCRARTATLLSVVEGPDAPPHPWLARRDNLAARGRLSRLLGPGRRGVWLYDPTARPQSGAALREHPVHEPGFAVSRRRLPVIVLFDGQAQIAQDLATTADNLIADGLIRPCVVVVPEAEPRLGGSTHDADADRRAGEWVVEELLPWVRSIAPVGDVTEDVIVAGQGHGAYRALRCALEHPEAVGAVLSQSAELFQRELYAAAPDLVHRLHAYVEVGTEERRLRELNRGLAAALVEAGADVHYVEVAGGYDSVCWRGGLADGLRALLGPPTVA